MRAANRNRNIAPAGTAIGADHLEPPQPTWCASVEAAMICRSAVHISAISIPQERIQKPLTAADWTRVEEGLAAASF
jgi:hypothetical protein